MEDENKTNTRSPFGFDDDEEEESN